MRTIALLAPLLLLNLTAGTTNVPAPEDKHLRIRLFAETPMVRVEISAKGPLLINAIRPKRAVSSLSLSVDGNNVVIQPAHRRPMTQMRTLRIQPFEKEPLIIKTGSRERSYAGVLEIGIVKGKLQIVNIVGIEDYTAGIIEGELGSLNLPPESLKAQMVASRSYALTMLGRHARQGYDYCDSPHCQVYSGIPQDENFRALAESIRGIVVTYHGKTIPAFYHDNCGGQTANASEVWPIGKRPYLRSVQDGSPDRYCRYAPRSTWTFKVKRTDLKDIFIQMGWLNDWETLDRVAVSRTDRTGRAKQILVQGVDAHQVSVGRFRNAINQHFDREVLPSTYFKISRKGDTYLIAGRGWGHGVGLCQCGTIEMAREGKTYTEILAHYFPGTGIAHYNESVVVSNPNALADSNLR